MAKPQVIYLLIALLFSAQFDDDWVGAPSLSSCPVAADDDEYLPLERHSEQSAPRQEPAQAGLNLPTVVFLSIERSSAPGFELAAPFDRSPLYVFMSLQC